MILAVHSFLVSLERRSSVLLNVLIRHVGALSQLLVQVVDRAIEVERDVFVEADQIELRSFFFRLRLEGGVKSVIWFLLGGTATFIKTAGS